MSETTLTPVVIASLVGATFATLGTVATLYLAGYFTQTSTTQPANGRTSLKERGRTDSARLRNNGGADQGNGRRSSPWRRNGSPAPRYYDASPSGREDPMDSHSTPGHLDQHNLQGPRRHGAHNVPDMDETPLYGINGGQRQRPASSLSMPQSGALGTSVSPNSALNNGQSPLNQQPTSPRKTMHPISTKPPRQITSPRNLNNSQTLLPHVTTSRPGSPIAAGTHTGIHVTSRVAQQQDGSQGVRPPPLHMMLHNTGRAPAPSGNTGLTTVKQTGARSRGEMIEAEAVSESFHRVIASESTMTEEEESVCHQLIQALDLRWKWWFRPNKLPEHDTSDIQVAVPSELDENHPWTYNPLPKSHLTFKMVDGVIRVFEPPVDTAQPQPQSEGPEAVTPPTNQGDGPGGNTAGPSPLRRDNTRPNLPHSTSSSSANLGLELFPLPGTDKDFFTDLLHLSRLSSAGPVLSYCHHRLTLLEQKFNLHSMLNASKETLAQKTAPHRDFYNVRKIDTHVHHSACMHQKHLLRFIKSKLKREPDEIVIFRDGKFLTLQEVFDSLNLTAYDLNVDTLDMHADKTIFHRFDRFNLKYNPFGQSRLREVFIKQDNLLHGRFLAELTKEVFTDLEETKYQHTEYRISIYGRKTVEWDILAAWVCQNGLYSDKNVWLIQVPRLYNVYKAQGLLDNFEQMLNNLFEPLFEVTADPSSHPQLHIFLQQVVGFDCVDDESKPERRPTKSMPKPAQWDNKYNAAYSYYIYYLYANLYVLNSFRQSRGLNTFTFRPHCGEAGELDHLASAFMCCDNIAHGINLRKSPMLQYLYYLAQIGLCMSPLSNNSLFLDYHKNPFPQYFARGLSVSLSTDDPLQIHLTKEPLVEEYSVAANMWKFSSTDLCEIARNSVLHSGFPHECKKHWLSSTYWKPGPLGNDIQKTNVPNLRMRFRYEVHQEEMRLLYLGTVEHTLQGSAALRLD